MLYFNVKSSPAPVVVSSLAPSPAQDPAGIIPGGENTVLKTIHSRKSVRHYTDRAVTKEQLTELVKAGMAAPTAANKQPWAFVAITERKTLDALAEKLPYAGMLKNATGAIAVVGMPQLGMDGIEREYWIQDCSAASQNILLAAESMGLGAVWTGVYPVEERVKAVREVLSIPDGGVPLNVIAVGYPTGVDKPKNKFRQDRLHLEKW